MLRYFISREFLFTLFGLAGLGILIYFLIFFLILPAYTRHGDGVLVPDVSEYPLGEAEERLDDAKLRIGLIDSVYIDHLPAGVVIKQYPAPYSRVKPKRRIALTLNKYTPPVVSMPEIEELTLYQAQIRLENWGLSIGRIIKVPDVAVNVVLEAMFDGQRITPGTKVPQGSKIDVKVASGKRGINVEIPNLLGYTYQDAVSKLREIGLGPGAIVYNPNNPDPSQDGKVYNQRPGYEIGDSIMSGSSIDLFIYGSEPQTSEGIIIQELEAGEEVPGEEEDPN